MIYNVFTSFFVFIVLGYLWRYIKGVPDSHMLRASINSLVLYILLPLLTFSVIYAAPLHNESWKIPFIAILVTLGCIGFSVSIYVLIKRIWPDLLSDKSIGALVLGASWCNATYLGYPIVTGILGKQYGSIPLIYDLLALTPLLWIIGAMIAGYYSDDTSSFKQRYISGLKRILGLPPLYALLLAILCKILDIDIHPNILKTCSIAGNAVPPLMMISVGMALNIPKLNSIVLILPAAIIRLAVGPLIAYGLIHVLHIQEPLSKAIMLESGMPTMVLTLVIAQEYTLDTNILAQLIALSTLLSIFSLSLI